METFWYWLFNYPGCLGEWLFSECLSECDNGDGLCRNLCYYILFYLPHLC